MPNEIDIPLECRAGSTARARTLLRPRVLQRPARLGDGRPDAARSAGTYFEAHDGRRPRRRDRLSGQTGCRRALDDLHRRRRRRRGGRARAGAGGRVIAEPHSTSSTRAGWRCAPTPRARSSAVWQADEHIGARGGQRARQLELDDRSAPRPRGRAALLRRGLRLGRSTRWTSAAPSVDGRGARATATTSSRSTPACASAMRRAARLPASATRRVVRPDQGDGRARLDRHVHGRRRRRLRDPRRAHSAATVLVEPFDIPWQRITVIRDPQGAHAHARASSSRRRPEAAAWSGRRAEPGGRGRAARGRAASALRCAAASSQCPPASRPAREGAARRAGGADAARVRVAVADAHGGCPHPGAPGCTMVRWRRCGNLACVRVPQAHAGAADDRGHLVRADADAGGAGAAVLPARVRTPRRSGRRGW